jgi:hypothetical protein
VCDNDGGGAAAGGGGAAAAAGGRDECYAMAEVEGVVEVKIEEAGVEAEVAAVGLSPHRGNTANNA